LLTNSSTTYCIAMVLHLGMKLEYFRNQDWQAEWIEEAESQVRDQYIAKYEKVADKGDKSNAMPTKNPTHDVRFASFDNLSVTSAPCTSKIQEYLNHLVENIKNPLRWWIDNQHVYPNLHHMALDYLSIPGK
jgi:hypothetical protein